MLKNSDKGRFVQSIERAMAEIRADAASYGYLNETEYKDFMRLLKEYKQKIEDALDKTGCGFPFEVTTEMNATWNEYDKGIATLQLKRFNRIYIDVLYRLPIDNEFELENIHKSYEAPLQGSEITKAQ